MNITKMTELYLNNRNLKAKLLKKIKLDNGTLLKKGTESNFLIDKGDGTYHFEANDTACVVSAEEIEILSNKPKLKK